MVDIETQSRSRTGALIAHVYELIDRGPELDRNALATMICDRALALVGANAAALIPIPRQTVETSELTYWMAS